MNFTNSVIISLIVLAFSFSFISCSYTEHGTNSTVLSHHAPPRSFKRTYSFPLEERVEYICCTNAPSPELAPLFNVQGRTLKSDMSMDTLCVRLDTLSTLEKIKIQNTTLTAANSCRTFQGAFEHFQCTCSTQCDPGSEPIEWICVGCPGVADGDLPKAAPDDFPQDSLHSRPEWISGECTPCGSGNICPCAAYGPRSDECEGTCPCTGHLCKEGCCKVNMTNECECMGGENTSG